MNRTFVSFPITDINDCKKRLLNWASRFEVCCFLDNHYYPNAYHSYECILAAGVNNQIIIQAGNAFSGLQQFFNESNDWIFGHLSYDLKNELEHLTSARHDGITLPDLFFFVPQIVMLLGENELSIGTLDNSSQNIYSEICHTAPASFTRQPPVEFQNRFSKDEYVTAVRQLQQHIRRGDCYEINFCQEFFSTNCTIDPLQAYYQLSAVSPNPFAAYYKLYNRYLCCASPERYLRKEADKLISQPIKGTWMRNLDDLEQDNLNKKELFLNSKERTENVMIVDLVRNDLSKVCEEGSVVVDELYGIYSFPQVHQMMSTVSGTINKDLHFVDAIKATFPMGSMTGAPKKRVMELIEHYEKSRRGLFSGAMGYVSPLGNFDFNVVIRSIFYNSEENYLSCQVGSAITFYSDPEKEYAECMLKATAIRKALS